MIGALGTMLPIDAEHLGIHPDQSAGFVSSELCSLAETVSEGDEELALTVTAWTIDEEHATTSDTNSRDLTPCSARLPAGSRKRRRGPPRRRHADAGVGAGRVILHWIRRSRQ